VQLKHLPTGIVVKSQDTRSRPQNRKIARRLLADKLDLLEKGEDSRVAIKSRDAAKKRASKLKKTRRKYRKLEDEKASATPKQADQDNDDPKPPSKENVNSLASAAAG
jgi:protein subunit release factor B